MEKSYNQKKLEEFFESIKDYPIIPIQIAKRMLFDDWSEKTINEVYFGALNSVYNFVKDKGYENLDSGSYDLEDILQSLSEGLLLSIQNKTIFSANSYGNLLQRIIKSSSFANNFGINSDEKLVDVSSVLLRYILSKTLNNKMPYTYENYLEDYKIVLNGKGLETLSKEKYYYATLVIEILRNSEFAGASKSFIYDNLYLLLDYANGYINMPLSEEASYEETDSEIKRIMDAQQIDFLFLNPKLRDVEIMVAKEMHGFDGEPLTLMEIAQKHGFTFFSTKKYYIDFLKKTRRYIELQNMLTGEDITL